MYSYNSHTTSRFTLPKIAPRPAAPVMYRHGCSASDRIATSLRNVPPPVAALGGVTLFRPTEKKSIWGPLLASLSLKTDGVSYLREPPISSRGCRLPQRRSYIRSGSMTRRRAMRRGSADKRLAAAQFGRSDLSAVCLISAVFPDRCQGQQSAAGCENDRALDDNRCFLNAHETVLRCGGYVGL